MQTPGVWKREAEPLRPLHYEQSPHGICLFLLLKKVIIGCDGLLLPVKVEMDERGGSFRVVLSEREGWAGDRFLDS